MAHDPHGDEMAAGEYERLREGYSPTLAWLKKWLFTTDHKEVGLLYFFTSLWFIAIGGTLALLMRTQLMFPAPWSFLPAGQYNQAVSTHGLIMVLFFLSPLGSAFANYFTPLQIGAKDVAFPRFNAFSYWMYVMGGIVFLCGFFVPGGAPAGGWTNYAPLSSIVFQPGPGETLAGLGLLMLWGSLTMGSVNLIITILTMRAPGMTWTKMPLFTWFNFFTQILLLFSVPSIFVGTLALVTDRALGTVFFLNPAGSTLLWTNMWWFFAHPEVYVVVLPAFGAVAEIFQTFTGRPAYAKKALLLSIGLIMVPFSFSIYAHHMFLTGINVVEREFIDINTEINSLPSGMIVICMMLTVIGGSIKFKAPFLFALGSIVVFIIGGITGVFDSSVFLDQQLRGTYQIVGHFHYIMVGAAEFGLLAAIYYYLPKWTGRMYSAAVAQAHFIFSFVFFNLTFFPMFYLFEMPRRIFSYLPATGWGSLNFIATLGAYGFGISQVLLLYILAQAFMGKGRPSPPNPWGAATPEWTGDASSYVTNYPAVLAEYPNGIPNGHTAHAAHVTTTPLNSKPLVISVGLGMTCIGIVVGLPLLIIGVALAIYGVYGWIKDDLHGVFKMPKGLADDPGQTWPFKPDSDVSFGEWRIKMGTWLFLASDFVFFAAIIGAYIFVRINLPTWPSIGSVFDVPVAALNTMLLVSSSLTVMLAYQAIREGKIAGTIKLLVATLLLGSAYLEITGVEWIAQFMRGFTFGSGLPGSIFYLGTGIGGAHVFAGLVMLAYLLKKLIGGGFGRTNHSTIKYFSVFWVFVVLVAVIIFPTIYLT